MKRDSKIPLYADPVFRTVCELEDTVRDAESLAHIICLIDEVEGSNSIVALHTLARLIQEKLALIDQARCELFDLTHPSRAEWEAAGGKEKWRRKLMKMGKAAQASMAAEDAAA